MAPLKVLIVAAECSPFAKTGGLGDVIGALPRALSGRGLDVKVVVPLYGGMRWDDLEPLEGALGVPMWFGTAWAGVRLGQLPRSAVPVYFLDYRRYFDRPFLYGPPGGAYADNLERFAFLSRGALVLAQALGWPPDVVHAHDWQAALAPVYLDAVGRDGALAATASVLTIHNLAFQGVFDAGAMFVTGLGPEHFHPRSLEHFGTLNLLKGGIRHATLLGTVSPTYAREIQTSAYGCGLDGELAARRADLTGILNGIDTEEWNPATDPRLPARFDATDLAGKARCKAALQQEAGLPVSADVPLLAFIGRLTDQKGLDVVASALDRLLALDVQLVLLGTGEPGLEHAFASAAAARPDRLRTWIAFDDALAHRIEGAADFFLMPSRFEPCGLSQLYSLRYGTLPIVRATGGLVDTVERYEEATVAGTGFVFDDLTPDAVANTVGWAVSTWYDRPAHITALRRRAMAQDFSWARAAAAYEDLYAAARRRRG